MYRRVITGFGLTINCFLLSIVIFHVDTFVNEFWFIFSSDKDNISFNPMREKEKKEIVSYFYGWQIQWFEPEAKEIRTESEKIRTACIFYDFHKFLGVTAIS